MITNKVIIYFFLLVFIKGSFAQNKFELEDFAISLEQITSGANHVWVNSGYTTVNPQALTVLGVNDFFSPPFAAKNFNFIIDLEIDKAKVLDAGGSGEAYGKGDVGLIYSGGTWYPDKIVRKGTYHHLKDGQLVSVGVTSELIPLFGQAGFIEKVSVTNRTKRSLKIKLVSNVQAGSPYIVPLNNWQFGTPKDKGQLAVNSGANTWSNQETTIHLFQENTNSEVLPGETLEAYFTVIIDKLDTDISMNAKEMVSKTKQAWEKRLAKYTKNIPTLESDIDGLEDYYKRSVLSGLICIWENSSYALNPFLATCGMDGGGTNAYLWDIAGYVPQMVTLMMDSAIIDVAKQMGTIDLNQFYAYTLDGTGTGVKYSYSPWAYTSLISTIFKFIEPDIELFSSLKTVVLNNEKLQADNHLIDYGVQHNLLEMRGTGWEHYTVSPNAERSWCLKQLAEMGNILKYAPSVCENWNKQAQVITHAIQKELWDNELKWFASVYPDGFKDFVYSIQVYDAIRAGVCTVEMEEALFSHLQDGAFLGNYGITSISKEDLIHYEVLDTDWSGGGAYTGDGPQLALILFEKNHPELAWDVLQRLFWMGKNLIYYPQEHFSDKPMSAQHKRANTISGLAGAEAILFGLVGFQPRYNGDLIINPQLVTKGNVQLKGFKFRNNSFDIELSTENMIIHKNGVVVYDGEPCQFKL